MLDFRMDTFLTVCRHMNYTRAADELHITQPAVSQQIKLLEKEYGVRLFVYQGKKLRLTEAGVMLQNAALTIKHDDLFLREKLLQTGSGAEKIVFGATLTAGPFAVVGPLENYLKRHPNVNVRMVVADTHQLLGMINCGEIDFAVVEGFFPQREYDFLTCSSEPFTAVCAPSYHFASVTVRTVEDLLDERLLVREKGSGTRSILEDYLHGHNLTIGDFPRRVEVNNIEILIRLAADGCGVTFLYKVAAMSELAAGTLREIRLRDFDITHDFTFIWRRGSAFSQNCAGIFREFFHASSSPSGG